MDRIEKFLRKLTEKERDTIETAIAALYSKSTASLDIKKLKGFDDIFRVRIGRIRIIFRKSSDDVEILEVSHRDENTYKSY